MKRSNVIFIIIAVVVAAGVAVVYMNYPPVDQRDAQGSIGAVQKYRTEQINNSGVVLADEKSRKEEAATYGEYLDQAAQLQSVSTALASFAQTLGSKDTVANPDAMAAKAELANVSRTIDARSDVLAQKMLELSTSLSTRQELQGFSAELASMQATLQSRNLETKQLESMQTTLAAMAQSLAVRDLASRNLDSKNLASRNLDSRNLDSRNLDSKNLASRNLDSKNLASRNLDSRNLDSKNLDSKNLDSRNLDSKNLASRNLDSKNLASRNLDSRNLDSRNLDSKNLASRNLEARNLFTAQASLAAVNRDLSANNASLDSKQLESINAQLAAVSTALAKSADMESRVLENQVQQLGFKVLEAKTLNQVKAELAAIDRSLAQRADLAAREAALSSISLTLASQAASLESMAVMNMQTRLESRNLEAKTLESMKSTVDSISRDLSSRNAMASKNLESIQKSLDSRLSDLAQKFVFSARVEMAAIGGYLDSRAELASKNLESRNLANKNLESMALASRNLQSFNAYLGNLNRSLDSQSALAARDRAELGARAGELQNRASELQAKFNPD